MKKTKLILGLILIIATAFILTGCGKSAKGIKLIANPPQNVIFTGDFEEQGLQVYKIFDNGQVQEYTSYKVEINNPKKEDPANGIRIITIKDLKETDVESYSFKVFTNKNYGAVLKESDSFYSVRFNKIELSSKELKLKTNYLFLNYLGGSFKFEDIDRGLDVFAIEPNASNKIVSREIDLQAFLKSIDIKSYKEIENLKGDAKFDTRLDNQTKGVNYIKEQEQKGTPEQIADKEIYQYDKARYNIKVKDKAKTEYRVYITDDKGKSNKEIMIPVIVAGGERPINKATFGWFDYISVSWMGFLIGSLSVGGFLGLGVLFTTIIVRTLAWPIYSKTNGMSSRMQKVQPEAEKIKRKYAGRTDKQSQRQMQMETMALYKKHKVGFSSMLLPFLQMPIFIGMYNAVRRVVIEGGYYSSSVIKTDFLGLDLLIGGHWTSYIAAAIVGVTMLLLQLIGTYKPKYLRKSLNPKDQQQQKKVGKTMLIFSVVMIGMMVFMAFRDNGIALYWIFGNLFSLFQVVLYKYLDYRKFKKTENKELI